MLSSLDHQVLVAILAISLFSAVRATPQDSNEPRFVLDVTLPGDFRAADPISITRITKITPATIGDGHENGFLMPAASSDRFMVAVPDDKSCLVWKDDATIGKGACLSTDDKTSFAVLCNSILADPPLCGVFMGQPSDQNCITYDGTGFKQGIKCNPADMQAT